MGLEMSAVAKTEHEAIEGRVMVKVRRIIAFLFLVMFIGLLDRANAGFASLTMNREIGLSPSQFGFGLGLFSIGEGLSSVPSNLAAVRWQPHRWLTILILAWGVVASAMFMITDPATFYVLRFLLGVAEAGTVPCILLIVSLWIPPRHRARTMAVIVAGSGLAAVVGPLIGAAVFRLEGLFGASGWRWLFAVEGIGTILVGIAAFVWLPADPSRVSWFTQAERDWLAHELRPAPASVDDGVVPASNAYRGFLAALLNFTVAASASVLAIWLPQLSRDIVHTTTNQTALISAPVYAAGVVGAILVGMWSDRVGGRFIFMASFSALCALALAISAWSPLPVFSFVMIVSAVVAIRCTGGIFFAALSEGVRGKARGHTFGLVILAGSLGGFAGNWLFGILREATGTFAGGLAGLAGLMMITAIAALLSSLVERRVA